MPKFYIHRDGAAYITEIVEIEAENDAAALLAVKDGDGDSIGLSVGDNCPFIDGEDTVFDAHPHNLPRKTGTRPAPLDFDLELAIAESGKAIAAAEGR